MKTRYRLLTLCLGFFLTGQVTGQQRPQYSLYMMNNFLLNPAISGIEDYTDVKLGYRNQWTDIEGAPRTFYASAHLSFGRKSGGQPPVPTDQQGRKITGLYQKQKQAAYFKRPKPHHGAGIIAMSDQIGPFNRSDVTLTYAFHLPVSSKWRVSMGASGGMHQFGINYQKVTFSNPNDPVFGLGREQLLRPELGLGVWAYQENFYLGASTLHFLSNQVTFENGAPVASGESNVHYYFTTGYRLRASQHVSFIPSVLVKKNDISPVSVDVNLQTVLINRIIAGLSYRHQDAVVAVLRFAVSPLLDIGYAYDHRMHFRNAGQSQSHELMLGFRFKNRRGVYCPQMLW